MKLDTSQIVTPDMQHIEDVFKQSGFDIRIVGGAVRDLLLGRTPKDIDFATDATPSEMKAIFDKHELSWIPTGEQHGTLTVLGPESREPFEITTLRIDTDTDGRHADVEFTRSWEKDAERRDLTYNALSMDLDGTVYDYHGGIADLKKNITKFVGNTDTRIQEDYLRILRYFRFQGRTSIPQFDPETSAAIRRNAKGLQKISGERIFMEMSKILTGNHVIELLKRMYATNVLQNTGLTFEFINELKRVIPLSGNLAIRLAALLGSSAEADALRNRWRFDNELLDAIKFICDHRNQEFNEDQIAVWLSNPKTNKVHVLMLLVYQGKKDLYDKFKNWKPPVFPITGKDLIAFGIKPGPNMGKILANLRDAWEKSGFKMSKNDLLHLLESDK